MLHRGIVQSQLTSRLSILSEMRAKLDRLAGYDAEMVKELEALVPKSMKKYIEEEGILRVMMDHGGCSTHIRLNEYGLKTKDNVRAAVKELQKAWKGYITVRLFSEETDRFSIRFDPTAM